MRMDANVRSLEAWRRGLAAVTTGLALLGIGLSVEHLLAEEHYNPGFAEHSGMIGAHVTLGAAYLALALPQLVERLRGRHPATHRRMGRAAVAAGVVAGGTALAITALFPYSGRGALVVVAPFAAWFVFALLRGAWLARRRRFAEHRAWMIRALAIGTSIATMRLIFVPAMLLLGDFEDEALARWVSLASFGAAFVLHAAVAEAWLRATPRAAVSAASASAPARA
jgi:hypothetical protein